MESVVMENCPVNVDENQDVNESQSAENFQKFMYDLFEKNGVMNDLRSYLRGHIVNVLRSAQTGNPPSCQKHFTQRLELTSQALNILIAEYLLRLEFSYTLSVFISEIPLANMVFSFAKTLMNKVDKDDSRPRFKDSDVWCILNYLGVKCDSDHASSIVEMYRLEQNSPLLLCILKSASLYREPVVIEQLNSSQESLCSSIKSTESAEKCTSPQRKPSFQEKCRHYVFCKTCQSKMIRIKEKYKKKKKDIAKMFEQLKSVYEAEMELLKQEEDKRVKKSLAVHTTQLQKRRNEMEESFKVREAELENNVQQKKRFLWGLARALRDQQQHMARAMHDVRAETTALTAKEDNLKSQLAEAEETLRQRGEDMRHQISEELSILEGHLDAMKKERDAINRERSQLERYKDTTTHVENEDLKPHYDLLKNELIILKKYLESAKLQPKSVIERGTITELNDVTSRIEVVLNNGQDVREERAKPKQLVNDLKKPKNVNFSPSNLDEIYRERSRSRSRSSASSEAGDAQFNTDSVQRLRDENEQLKCIAKQQREHIDSLSSQQARLQVELTASRMRAAPSPAPPPAPPPAPVPTLHALTYNQRVCASASVNNFSGGGGWHAGAGEQLSWLSRAQPRVLLPGDAIPFIGVTRHTDNRRYLINQWRSLRRRISPLSGCISKTRANSPVQRNLRERPNSAGPSVRIHLDQVENDRNSQPNEHTYQQGYQRPGMPEYHRPAQEYNTPTQEFSRPVQEFNRTTEEYSRPTEEYNRSAPEYSRPAEEYNRPTQEYNRPVKEFNRPIQEFNRQVKEFNRPIQEFNRPAQEFNRPIEEYSIPEQEFNKPAEEYSRTVQEFKRPAQECYPQIQEYRRSPTTPERPREKSPKSVLREAKENLRNKDTLKDTPSKREKSPNCLLREARLRLRKLEIEAEAVEKSYLDFRRKQQAFRGERGNKDTDNIDSKASTSTYRLDETFTKESTSRYEPNNDYDRYLKEYQTTITVGEHFKNKNTTAVRLNPIPNVYSARERKTDYLKTPLTEFRKYYHTEQLSKEIHDSTSKLEEPIKEGKGTRKEIERQARNDKMKQLELLKHNIGKIYNMPEQAIVETPTNDESDEYKDKNDSVNEQNSVDNSLAVIEKSNAEDNLLRIEIESVTEVNDLNPSESEAPGMLLIIESSVDNSRDAEISEVENDKEDMSTQMTIVITPKDSPTSEVVNPKDELLSDRSELNETERIVSVSESVKLSRRTYRKGIIKSVRKNVKSPREIKTPTIDMKSRIKDIESPKKKSPGSVKSDENYDKMTTDDVVAIYHSDNDGLSSIHMRLNLSKASNELEQNEDPDYPDDFSADVDNYNSRSEYETHSPISLPKTSEDDNFWDS